eukprot:scaffold6528_cov114-Cylindrotheca_fusiformis.AAC.18
MKSSSSSSSEALLLSTTRNHLPFQILYRNAKPQDLPEIANLLFHTFEEKNENDQDANDKTTNRIDNPNDTNISNKENNNNKNFWSQLFSSPSQKEDGNGSGGSSTIIDVNYIQEQLKRRMTSTTTTAMMTTPHMLIVGVIVQDDDHEQKKNNNNNNHNNNIVAFMELGTMPLPRIQKEEDDIPPNNNNKNKDNHRNDDERPYLANLAVDQKYRRQKVGSKLVQLAIQIATKWEQQQQQRKITTTSNQEAVDSTAVAAADGILFLSVECTNDAALQFYKKLEFVPMKLENERDRNERTPAPKVYLQKKLGLLLTKDTTLQQQ